MIEKNEGNEGDNMDTLDAIRTRRSIRKYKDQKIPDEIVQKILAAAMAAPSAGNQQPWHFVIIKDKRLLYEIPKFHQYSAMCREAALAILVCGDPEAAKHVGFWTQDCSAATQNILLAAHSLGIGAVWVGIYPEQDGNKFRKLLSIPQKIIPFSLIPMGYPNEEYKKLDRFKRERVHDGKW